MCRVSLLWRGRSVHTCPGLEEFFGLKPINSVSLASLQEGQGQSRKARPQCPCTPGTDYHSLPGAVEAGAKPLWSWGRLVSMRFEPRRTRPQMKARERIVAALVGAQAGGRRPGSCVHRSGTKGPHPAGPSLPSWRVGPPGDSLARPVLPRRAGREQQSPRHRWAGRVPRPSMWACGAGLSQAWPTGHLGPIVSPAAPGAPATVPPGTSLLSQYLCPFPESPGQQSPSQPPLGPKPPVPQRRAEGFGNGSFPGSLQCPDPGWVGTLGAARGVQESGGHSPCWVPFPKHGPQGSHSNPLSFGSLLTPHRLGVGRLDTWLPSRPLPPPHWDSSIRPPAATSETPGTGRCSFTPSLVIITLRIPVPPPGQKLGRCEVKQAEHKLSKPQAEGAGACVPGPEPRPAECSPQDSVSGRCGPCGHPPGTLLSLHDWHQGPERPCPDHPAGTGLPGEPPRVPHWTKRPTRRVPAGVPASAAGQLPAPSCPFGMQPVARVGFLRIPAASTWTRAVYPSPALPQGHCQDHSEPERLWRARAVRAMGRRARAFSAAIRWAQA